MFIYKIVNKLDGKVYIGQTISPVKQRWQEHCCAVRNGTYKMSNSYIHKAMKAHGIENFEIQEIDSAAKSQNELNQLEKHYIKLYETFNNPSKGYNLTEGGDSGGKMADSICLQRSMRMKGTKLSDLTKQRISEGKKLNPFIPTSEYREKIRQTSIGRIFTPESIEQRAQKLRGQKRTKEQKERMSKAALGRTLSNEHKQKIGKSLKGKTGVYFVVNYLNGDLLGYFFNIRDFCLKYPIMSDVSLKQLLSDRKLSCNGYIARRITKQEYNDKISSI